MSRSFEANVIFGIKWQDKTLYKKLQHIMLTEMLVLMSYA